MRQIEIIEEIANTIKEECKNKEDYYGYVENCLFYDKKAMGQFYGQTIKQIEYLTSRALLRIS